ncbi:MAG: hypothetical protein ACYC4J_01225 [Gemmatimonadaceae bacterium]
MAQSKQERIAYAILNAKPVRIKAESGPTIAWETSHRWKTKTVAVVNPQALAWVKENEVAVQALATVDGKHIPWPDGSVDGKGVKDRRLW